MLLSSRERWHQNEWGNYKRWYQDDFDNWNKWHQDDKERRKVWHGNGWDNGENGIGITGVNLREQGKSEGFESCDRPIVRKRPIWVKMGDVLYRVTLKFDGWPWKIIGHLSFAVSSFVQHFIAIGEFKLELQFGNAQFGSKSTIFLAVWPCNLTYDLEKQ